MIASNPIAPLKILLAVDGSQHSVAAVNLLTCIAWPVGTFAQALALVPERLPIMDSDPKTQIMVDEALELVRWRDWAAAKILTTEVAAKLRDHDLSVKTEICEGRPVDVILKHSQDQPPNLVVVGAKSFSPPGDFRLGPTAHKLTHYTDYSVLVARPSTQVRPLSTVLVVDDSPEAQWAVDFLCALSLPQWARVTVVTMVEEKEGVMAGMSLSDRYPPTSPPQAIPDAAVHTARVIEHLHNYGAQVHSITCVGQPVDKILSVAHDQKASLIVLGTRSQSLTESFSWDGVVQKMVKYAPCSVLAVRSRIKSPAGIYEAQTAGIDHNLEHLLTSPPSRLAELLLQK